MLNNNIYKFSTTNSPFLELLSQKIKTLLLLAVFAFSSSYMSAQNTSLISNCSDFVTGSNPAWPYVLIATTPDSLAASQGSQTFTMNVTDTANGASVRVYKTTANGNNFFGNPIALTLGSNSITVAAVTFDRAVKFQFSSGDVEFDALSLNGVGSDCIVNVTSLNEYNDILLNTFPNPSYGDLFINSNDPIELLEIKDLSGRVVFEMSPQKSKIHIQTSQLKKSFYILNCTCYTSINN